MKEVLCLLYSLSVYLSVGTIFAYGQTSSGKTFTMKGDDGLGEIGIIQMCIQQIYEEIEQVTVTLLNNTFSLKESKEEVD